MNNYKINFAANTITITKDFELAANNPKSEEYKLLKLLQKDYPNMEIRRKTHRSPKACNLSKGLTYANMERYISVFQNAAELLERLEEVKALAAIQPNSYKYVKTWFVSQFPNYKKLPDFAAMKKNGEVIPAPILELDEAS